MDYSAEKPGDTLLSESLLIERLPVAVERAFSSSFIEDMDKMPEVGLRIYEDALGDMAVQLRSYMWAEKLAEKKVTVSFKEKVHFPTPTSWWQMLKRDSFPRWYLRRWPSRETHVTKIARGTRHVLVEQFATFPMSPLRTPPKYQGSHAVRYERARVDSA